jgi:4-hydroxy-tetrahydrodipicolinate reductase
MTRIIVNGCNGKMGRVLSEAVMTTEGFELVAGVDPGSGEERGFPVYVSLQEVKEAADVVIDFSVPEGLGPLMKAAVEKKIPVVIATTGLGEEHFSMMEKAARSIPVFQAANMSLGINLLKLLVRQAAAVLGPAFDIEIVEKHHRTKRDAPSGTALALADSLKTVRDYPFEYVYGRREKNRLRTDQEIGIHAVRGGTIVGEHDVIFAGKDEVVTLSHTAYSRGLFAMGALQAAAYVVRKKPGFYRMEDMIGEAGAVTRP